jgi:hypothetical protein
VAVVAVAVAVVEAVVLVVPKAVPEGGPVEAAEHLVLVEEAAVALCAPEEMAAAVVPP